MQIHGIKTGMVAGLTRFASSKTASHQANQSNSWTYSRAGITGFKDLLSRSKPRMTDEEFFEAAREQAKIDAANGVCNCGSSDFCELRASFMSVVSPDRRSIIASGLAFQTGINFGGTSYNNLQFSCNGEAIACFENGVWSVSLTQAEVSRKVEIVDVYLEAWKAARYGTDGSNQTDTAYDYVKYNSTFDSRA